jgi:release factor glutamine methyltransferase
VLIPRPDTETLIDAVIGYSRKRYRAPSIIDVCTGSGCIGITLALELDAEITLCDISEGPCPSQGNAKRLLTKPVTILQGNLLSPTDANYDIIVSNPPYLTTSWCDEVSQEVRWEPRLALEGFMRTGLLSSGRWSTRV